MNFLRSPPICSVCHKMKRLGGRESLSPFVDASEGLQMLGSCGCCFRPVSLSIPETHDFPRHTEIAALLYIWNWEQVEVDLQY